MIEQNFGFKVESYERFGEHNNNINLLLSSGGDKIFAKVMGSETVDGCRFELNILSLLGNAVKSMVTIKPLSKEPLVIDDVPVGIYEAIDAQAISREDIDLDLLGRVAAAQSNIHDVLSSVQESPRVRFLPDDLSFVEVFGMGDDEVVRKYLPLLETQLSNTVFDGQTKTIIHDDISMENILKNENDLYLVDFSDAHYSYRISDIANTIKELIIDNFGLDLKMIEGFIHSYNESSIEVLSVEELKSLPYLYTRRAFFMYCYYGSKEEDDFIIGIKTRQLKTLEFLREIQTNE
jgi:hypothetical protein